MKILIFITLILRIVLILALIIMSVVDNWRISKSTMFITAIIFLISVLDIRKEFINLKKDQDGRGTN